jgi:hypothetical protein
MTWGFSELSRVERVRAGGRSTSYWELADDALLDRAASGEYQPKAASAYHVVGTSVPWVDLPDKLTGRPRFVPSCVRRRPRRPCSPNVARARPASRSRRRSRPLTRRAAAAWGCHRRDRDNIGQQSA